MSRDWKKWVEELVLSKERMDVELLPTLCAGSQDDAMAIMSALQDRAMADDPAWVRDVIKALYSHGAIAAGIGVPDKMGQAFKAYLDARGYRQVDHSALLDRMWAVVQPEMPRLMKDYDRYMELTKKIAADAAERRAAHEAKRRK